jgi:hypothetical protein
MESRPVKLSAGNVRALSWIAKMRSENAFLQENDKDRELARKQALAQSIKAAQQKAEAMPEPEVTDPTLKMLLNLRDCL